MVECHRDDRVCESTLVHCLTGYVQRWPYKQSDFKFRIDRYAFVSEYISIRYVRHLPEESGRSRTSHSRNAYWAGLARSEQVTNVPDHAHDTDGDDVAVAVLTVSSSRSLEADPAGDAIATILGATAASVDRRELVADHRPAIRKTVEEFASTDVDAVVTTGGTGLTPDDVTVEVVRELFDREIPGFGEFFRRRSADEVGTAAMASRATAGVIDGTVVFCLPGSENAARFGTEELIVPELGHFVHLVGR